MKYSKAEKAKIRQMMQFEMDIGNYEQAKKYGNILFRSKVELEPLKNIDFTKLTMQNFIYLKRLGYINKEIARACRISQQSFSEWVKDSKLTYRDLQKMGIEFLDMTDEYTNIPYVDEISE